MANKIGRALKKGPGKSSASRTRATLAAAVIVFGSFSLSPETRAQPTCEGAMRLAARSNDMPLNILYAVGLTESGRNGVLQPFEMNIDGRSEHSSGLREAITKFHVERSRGARMIDIGCMQINYRWHGDRFKSLASIFDPGENVDYAARFLKELWSREGSWTLAVARYNAGPNNDRAQKTYVCSVIGRMVQAGVGQWTIPARQFCGESAR